MAWCRRASVRSYIGVQFPKPSLTMSAEMSWRTVRNSTLSDSKIVQVRADGAAPQTARLPPPAGIRYGMDGLRRYVPYGEPHRHGL